MSLQSQLSTEREVVLDSVDFSTSGQYRCDVSGDAPMFQTDSIEGLLFVVGQYHIVNRESIPKQSLSMKVCCVKADISVGIFYCTVVWRL